MERELAERLMARIAALNAELNTLDPIARQIAEGSERKGYLHGVAAVMLSVYEELMRPIVKQFPDLDPDRDPVTGQWK
jgi:hypothetical protein